MLIYISDVFFTVLFGLGLFWMMQGEIKLALQVGTAGKNSSLDKVIASKPILIEGQLARCIGLVLVLMSGFFLSQYKLGDILFSW